MGFLQRVGNALSLNAQPGAGTAYPNVYPPDVRRARVINPAIPASRRLEQRSLPDPDPEGSLADLINRLRGAREQPWRSATVGEALSVPANFRAVTLISNVVGSLSWRAFRDGIELAAADRPRLIVRPNPFTTPREFYRETAYSMACYGEAFWWIAARDADGLARSLLPMHPREVVITENRDDPRFPFIDWRNKRMRNSDVVQIKMSGEPGALRGMGPLQRCGAAVSIAVEAQEWAANFYALGGIPSILIKSAIDLTDDEAADLKAAWVATPGNMPKVVDGTIDDVKTLGTDVESSQMIAGRDWQNGDAARMFGIPGTLLSYAVAGSSLTYQNVGQEFDKFIRVCLLPDYLQPMEAAMSDLLTRNTTAEANTSALRRADAQTQMDIAMAAFNGGAGIANVPEARAIAGLDPDLEQAPVPFSAPQAFPSAADFAQRAMPAPAEAREVRCNNLRKVYGKTQACGAYLGRLAPGSEAYCAKCKGMVKVAPSAQAARGRQIRRTLERDDKGTLIAIVESEG